MVASDGKNAEFTETGGKAPSRPEQPRHWGVSTRRPGIPLNSTSHWQWNHELTALHFLPSSYSKEIWLQRSGGGRGEEWLEKRKTSDFASGLLQQSLFLRFSAAHVCAYTTTTQNQSGAKFLELSLLEVTYAPPVVQGSLPRTGK